MEARLRVLLGVRAGKQLNLSTANAFSLSWTTGILYLLLHLLLYLLLYLRLYLLPHVFTAIFDTWFTTMFGVFIDLYMNFFDCEYASSLWWTSGIFTTILTTICSNMHVFTLTRSAEEWACYSPPAILLLAILLLAILLLAIWLPHTLQGPLPRSAEEWAGYYQ